MGNQSRSFSSAYTRKLRNRAERPTASDRQIKKHVIEDGMGFHKVMSRTSCEALRAGQTLDMMSKGQVKNAIIITL